MEQYKKCLFAVESRTHGIYGEPYKSVADAIADGAYGVWDERRIKSAHGNGNGTLKDFQRHCKDNKVKILSADEFFPIFDKLPCDVQETHLKFIRELMHY